jgi:hypothetical protein
MTKITAKDLLPLRLPALALAVALVFAWIVVGGSATRLADADTRLRAQKSMLDDVRNRYQRSDDERATIQRYLPEYRQLVQEGFIGAERRIAWIEALRDADTGTGLYGIEYQIDAQTPYSRALQAGTISQRLRQSTMRLNFGVTHEGDLLRFLRAMENKRAGIFAVDSCSLQPIAGSESPVPRRANLNARCEIRWMTVSPPEEPSA